DHLAQLVGIADIFGDPPIDMVHHFCALAFSKFKFSNFRRWSTASRTHSSLAYWSIRGDHSHSATHLMFKKDVSNSITQDSIMNVHKKTQLTRARINYALKESSYDSPLPKNFKHTILASNESSSSTKVFKRPDTKDDSIFTQLFNHFKVPD
ncbi:hypothetical protein H5410_027807, partial [Solanum commersonii]